MVNADNESVGNAAADVIKWSYVSHSNAPQRIREDFESLEARWRKDAGANGQTSGFSLCRVSSVTNSRGRSLVQWIAAFEAVTGKQIAWVDTDQSVPLPWFAATSEERPNTIFLHVRAQAHALALVGHEWGHTLEIQDPTLYQTPSHPVSAPHPMPTRPGPLKSNFLAVMPTRPGPLKSNFLAVALSIGRCAGRCGWKSCR